MLPTVRPLSSRSFRKSHTSTDPVSENQSPLRWMLIVPVQNDKSLHLASSPDAKYILCLLPVESPDRQYHRFLTYPVLKVLEKNVPD